MHTLEIHGQRAIYIDHYALINKLYEKCLRDSTGYELKAQLFNFKPKTARLNNSCSRKRKSIQDRTEGLVDFEITCQTLLDKLKTILKIPSFLEEEDIGRVWEEINDYPQMRGENTLNIFHTITLKNKVYIIPPRCRFFNYDVLNLTQINFTDVFDLVVIDPPWKNKYIRRIKRAKEELGYKMLNAEVLATISIDKLINQDSIVAVWCTNSLQHQNVLIENCFPRWNLRLLHKITWLKLNTRLDLVGKISEQGKKQPYEVLFIAHHKNCHRNLNKLKDLSFILSIPSIIHSHKPPILDIFRNTLPTNPRCLELFARYLQPEFTSIGLEVLKLMDMRLYTKYTNTTI